jgi:hypothetical protein
MKKILFIFLILIINFDGIRSQVFTKDDLRFSCYNTLFNGIAGGIGAGMNKHKGESFIHAFKNNFYKGVIGGALNYGGMKIVQVSAMRNNIDLIWPGRMVNSLGTSITYNAINNSKMFSYFQTNIFCFNISYNGKIHCLLDPVTLGYAGYLLIRKDMTFNMKNSVMTGSVTFNQKSDNTIIDNGNIYLSGVSGLTFGNTLFIKDVKQYLYISYHDKIGNINTFQNIKDWKLQTLCHEIIHTFQYEQSYSLNNFTINKLHKFSNIYNKYLYINSNFGILYEINNINYNKNFFETEANFFGNSNYYNKNNYFRIIKI